MHTGNFLNKAGLENKRLAYPEARLTHVCDRPHFIGSNGGLVQGIDLCPVKQRLSDALRTEASFKCRLLC